MSQKDYNTEIILQLLRGSNHIRGLAKMLHTNQTTVARKVEELAQANVVDYAVVGRNKTYSLKKTTEAQQYAFMAEHYKLLSLLEKYPGLRGIIDKVQKNKDIKLAVLFGSYAKGLSHKDSDIDIYAETDKRKIKEELEQLNTRISAKIGKYDRNSALIQEMEKNHVIIKGVEAFYERTGFFAQAEERK